MAASGDGLTPDDLASGEVTPTGSSWKRKLAPIAGFFGVQIVVQILSLATGLLLVRMMRPAEYALYTIANTMQGAIAVLADSGTGSALTSIGGRVWQDKRRLGELIQTALGFRRRFGAAAALCVGPILFWLIYSQGTSLSYAALLSLTVLTASSIALTHGVLVMVPRLHTRIHQLQNAELLMAGLRIVLVGIACLLGVNAVAAVAITVVTLGLQNWLYRHWASRDADLTAPQNDEDRRTIWKLVRQQAANGLYYCVQGPLTVFLVAALGSSKQVADLGALGRIAVILTVISAVVSNLVIPRYARCQNPQRLASLYRQIVGAYIGIAVFFVTLGVVCPAPFLWILGSQYRNLQAELPFILFASSTSAMAGVLYSLNAARGWLQGAWLVIPITLISQAALIPFLNLKSIQGAILFTTLPIFPALLPYLYRARCEFLKLSRGKITT